ncbi:hypothetical protein [Bradyrhizobium sp. USDA 10063]
MSDEAKGFWGGIFRLAHDLKHPVVDTFVLAFFTVGTMILMFSIMPILGGVMRMATGFMSGDLAIQSIWRDCLDIKQVGNRAYKINQCKGTIEPLNKDDDED